MRNFIDLIENLDTKTLDFNKWFDSYGTDVAEGSGILDDLDENGVDINHNTVRAAVEERFAGHVERVMERIKLPMYRGMTVSRAALAAILDGQGQVGVHWSVDPAVAHQFSREGDGELSIIMSATVPESSVDIERSIYLSFINFEDEDEVRLKPHSPVHITKIVVIDKKTNVSSQYDTTVTDSTGPNLWGSPYEE